MVHFWFILSIVSGLAAPSFTPPEHYIIDYQCFNDTSSDILNNQHALSTQQGVSSQVRSSTPPTDTSVRKREPLHRPACR